MGYNGAQRDARGIMGCKWHKGVKRLPREYKRDTGGYWGNNGVQEVHNEGTRSTMGKGDTREVFKRVLGKNQYFI